MVDEKTKEEILKNIDATQMFSYAMQLVTYIQSIDDNITKIKQALIKMDKDIQYIKEKVRAL